jgi:hypothetical protein
MPRRIVRWDEGATRLVEDRFLWATSIGPAASETGEELSQLVEVDTVGFYRRRP